jgi:hypothetical protein
MSNNLYPTLDNLISVENLPTQFAFVQNAADNFLQSTFYKNHSFVKSRHGDYATINLEIVLYKELGFKIPGTELSLLLNAGNNSTETVIPISFEYNWRILRYAQMFSLQNFSGSPKGFFDLTMDVAGCNPKELFEQVIVDSVAGGGVNELQNWVTGYNTKNPSNTIPKLTSATIKDCIEELLINLQNINVDPTTILFNQSIGIGSLDNITNNIQTAFKKQLGDFSLDTIKQYATPHFRVGINDISVSLTIPRNILKPVSVDPTTGVITVLPEPQKSLVKFHVGSLIYDSKDGLIFNNEDAFSLTKSQILDTGLVLTIDRLKVDLSRTTNIPEADADGRPKDFIGIYMLEGSIEFPKFLNPDASDAKVYARNLLVGTGGISGFLGLEPINYPINSTDPPPAIKFKLGNSTSSDHFELGLHTFNMEFKQNAITQSNLKGYLKIPGFIDSNGNQALIDICMHIAANGDINVTASSKEEFTILVANALELKIRSVSVGRVNNRWYIEASATLKIIAQIPGASSDFAAHPIDITRLRIWEDGSIEFEGGGIPLPTHLSLKIGPVSLQLEHITFRPHVAQFQGIDRQYYCLGFNGSLKTGPGGVDVRGDGFEFHFTRSGSPFHSYLRVAGIGVDIKIPGNATKEDADVYLGGYLSMRNGANPATPVPGKTYIDTSGPAYQGTIAFNIKKLKLSGKGSMMMQPKIPSWIVDIELGLSVPITLGATGLGIYGFRGLIGNNYVASKTHVGLNEDDPWFEYLKKKVPQPNKQGVYAEKFDPNKKGFSFGVGATIATMGDDGWTFSSKLFVMLSLPELLLIEGQANVLSNRLGINDEADPPFYAFLAVSNTSIEAGIGVNYGLPSSSGSILKMQGEMQLGFFFNNGAAWYLNIGRDLPAEKRVQARLLTLFNAYAYLMINASGIKAGAGAGWNLNRRLGLVRLIFRAQLNTMGFISFKPVQIGGAIDVSAELEITIFGIGFGLGASAGLSAEAPMPFIIAGYIEVRIKLLFKRFRIRIGLTWIINEQVNTEEIKLLENEPNNNLGAAPRALQLPYKATHMLTEERYHLYEVIGNSFTPLDVKEWEPYTIPMDSFIDIEFKQSIKPFTTNNNLSPVILGGGIAPLPKSTVYIAPQKVRYPQVKHNLTVENVKIQIWNPKNSRWDDYNPWDALTASFQKLGITTDTQSFPFGYWQYNNLPGKYTSLRLLAQSPFALLNGTPPEQFGLLSSNLLCRGELKKKNCQNWMNIIRPAGYSSGNLLQDRELLVYLEKKKGILDSIPNVFGLAQSLKIEANNKIEFYFTDSIAEITIKLSSIVGYKIIAYRKVFTDTTEINGLQSYVFEEVFVKEVNSNDYSETFNPITIQSGNDLIDKVEIIANSCEGLEIEPLYSDYLQSLLQKLNLELLNPNLTIDKKNQILLWIEQISWVTMNINFRIIEELCPVWQNMLNENANTGAYYSGLDYLYGWRQLYCATNHVYSDFGVYLFGNKKNENYGMCKKWDEIIALIDSRWNEEEVYEYHKTLKPLINLWKLKYCKLPLIKAPLIIFELYNTWNNLLSNGNLSADEINTINELINWQDANGRNLEYFWNQFNNIQATLCSQWTEILEKTGEYDEFHQYVAEWKYEYCLVNTKHLFEKCSLFIHEICWITEKDWEYNLLLQQNSQAEITKGYTNLANSVNEVLAPIWRPNSYFKIEVNTLDQVSHNRTSLLYRKQIQFAFKTGLPIGFYHKSKKEFNDLEQINKADQFKLSSLKHYIDYQRSYPNADGKLINAKPLYYNNPSLGLYFIKTYVNEFFTEWDSYKNTTNEKFKLICSINDPVDKNIAEDSSREKEVGWILHKTEPIPLDAIEFEVVSSLLNQSEPNCTHIKKSINPPTVSSLVEFNLKPKKLYNALYKVKHNDVSETPTVHSYNFETSKYKNFEEHIQSVYRNIDSRKVKAEFPIVSNTSFISTLLTNFKAIIDGTLNSNDDLITNYPSIFDRVLFGLFGFKAMQAVTDVEINVIRTKELNPKTNKYVKKVVGILVKSPEPFNDPKLPLEIMAETFSAINESREDANHFKSTIILNNAGVFQTNIIDFNDTIVSEGLLHIFSKDNSNIFITNKDLNMPLERYRLDFKYATFDGKRYDTTSIKSSLKVFTNRI